MRRIAFVVTNKADIRYAVSLIQGLQNDNKADGNTDRYAVFENTTHAAQFAGKASQQSVVVFITAPALGDPLALYGLQEERWHPEVAVIVTNEAVANGAFGSDGDVKYAHRDLIPDTAALLRYLLHRPLS